jgi:hypothetical protein
MGSMLRKSGNKKERKVKIEKVVKKGFILRSTWLPLILIFSATWVKVILAAKAPGYMPSAKRTDNKCTELFDT